MSAISSPVYDPKTTAENLANAYIAPTKASLDSQSAKATATASGLTTLGSALSAFQSSLAALTTKTTGVTANSATFSNTAIGTATADATAVAGTYSFYVEQLATAGQVSYNVADSAAAGTGSMKITLADGSDFQVDLANADSNGDGTLTAKEIAAAVNASAANDSRITASTLTVNGQPTLVLSSAKTGAANAVAAIDVGNLNNASLGASLGAPKVLATAADAVVWVGGPGGTKVQQASNTFNIIDGVSFTATQAQATPSAVTLTVAADSSATATNVQTFLTAYNTLLGVLDTLTAAGDHTVAPPPSSDPNAPPTPVSQDAAFHSDSGVTALRSRLGDMLRAATGGVSLISFGISASKDGTLTLDTGRLNKTIAANPGKLDSLFGRAGLGVDSGVLGSMNKLLTSWTSSSSGFITQRQQVVSKQQDDLAKRNTNLTDQFNSAYSRYLAQFTALQQLQSSMGSTSDMFTALFSPDKS
jgi:flagellar hook-associated protein 2